MSVSCIMQSPAAVKLRLYARSVCVRFSLVLMDFRQSGRTTKTHYMLNDLPTDQLGYEQGTSVERECVVCENIFKH